MHVIAAKAVSFHEALQPQFKTYAAQVVKNASVLAEAMKKRGFKLITGGTDNHLILTDVKSSFGVHGGIVEKALDEIGLTANKNAIPNDPEPPFRRNDPQHRRQARPTWLPSLRAGEKTRLLGKP